MTHLGVYRRIPNLTNTHTNGCTTVPSSVPSYKNELRR